MIGGGGGGGGVLFSMTYMQYLGDLCGRFPVQQLTVLLRLVLLAAGEGVSCHLGLVVVLVGAQRALEERRRPLQPTSSVVFRLHVEEDHLGTEGGGGEGKRHGRTQVESCIISGGDER